MKTCLKIKQLKYKKGVGRRNIGPKLVWQDVESAFSGRIKTGVIINKTFKDAKLFLQKCKQIFKNKIKAALANSTIKVNVVFSGEFILPHSGEIEIKTFNTRNEIISKTTNLNEWYEEFVLEKILKKLEEFQERDSGWSMREILHLKVHINTYHPITVNSYFVLPDTIQNRKAIINIKNKDDFCFLWAVTSALHPAEKNSNHISSYPHYSRILKYDGIKFPIQLKDVPKFEDMNSLSINVYTLENINKDDEHVVVPVSLSQKKFEKTIHLLIRRCIIHHYE